MRRWLGLLLVLYSLVPMVNATVPLVAGLSGDELTVTHQFDSYECTEPVAAPPLAGLYGSCAAEAHPAGGPTRGVTLHGPGVTPELLGRTAKVDASGWGGQVYLPTTALETVVGIVGPILFLTGLAMFVGSFRRTRTPQEKAAA
jgi:hypothetical protein